MSLLWKTLLDSDIADILRIQVGGEGMQNYLACNFNKNGLFTVKVCLPPVQLVEENYRGAS
jgi:hypothetical protein